MKKKFQATSKNSKKKRKKKNTTEYVYRKPKQKRTRF